VIQSHNNPVTSGSTSEPVRLPKRDRILLPALSLLTILLMFGVCEILARVFWPTEYSATCNVDDAVDGDRFKPNCTVRAKIAEGPWITYHYNECGYRSATSCGPKPPGTIRIAILGSSMSQALHVPYDQTFFARVSYQLAHLCNRPVDVQNLGVPGSSPINAYRRVQEALALKPDIALYLVVPYDLKPPVTANQPVTLGDLEPNLVGASAKPNLSPLNRLEHILIQSRAVLIAQHFILQDRENFIRSYMMYGDKADYLRQPFTPAWQQRFADLDPIIGDMTDKLHAAGVPLIVIAVPSRAEAALLSSPTWPAHVDPFAFGREIEAIASRHGAAYLDLMETFSHIPNAERLYYVVDGHVTSDGHKIIADRLIKQLQDDRLSPFSHCVPQQSVERRP
jgi:hypothetical protein